MVKRKRAAILPTNIILLQNLVKRDPESYREEFLQQYSHYSALRDIFMASSADDSTEDDTEFIELIGFVSSVCSCYPTETANFPQELQTLLLEHHRSLTPDIREKIIQSMTMLRNKGTISAEMLIQTLFPLLTATLSGGSVKMLRKQIYQTLITLLKSVNTGTKAQKINRSTQALLFNLLEHQDASGLWATKLTRELWRRGIWDDSRTVEIMTQAALHTDVKIVVSGIKFFLGADKEREENFEENSDDDDAVDMNALRHRMQINKKTSKRGKKLEAAVKQVKKKANKANNVNTYLNFSAIHLLRDPQGFAEGLFDKHLSGKSSKFDLEQKIDIMNLISRLIGTHKLTVLGIYTFFLKYLTPKQRDVTRIMAAAAQSCHDLVPPESISVMVRKIADEFVSDGVASEVAAAGINTIREILTRNPLAIEETLLHDLVEYKGSKAKPVSIAAKSLLGLYREVAPEMLKKKDRGKTAAMEVARGTSSGMPQFGVEHTVTGIEGLELLAKWKQENDNGDEERAEDWEVDEDDEDDVEGEWVTVDSDKEYNVDMSDSDDEPEAKKRKIEKEDSDLELSDDEETKKEEAEEKIDADTALRTLAATRILTPADFKKLDELKTQQGVEKIMGKGRNEDEVDSSKLVGPVKYKQLREERIAAAREGKDDREKFGSRRGKRDEPHSTTNREKARKKNFVMMIHKKSVQGKNKMSLRDKQKVLRAHISKQKKKGH